LEINEGNQFIFTRRLMQPYLNVRVDIQKYMVDTYNCSSLLYGEPLPGSRYCDVEDSSTMPESFWHLRSYV